jgi:hypothetical protein
MINKQGSAKLHKLASRAFYHSLKKIMTYRWRTMKLPAQFSSSIIYTCLSTYSG